MITPTEDGILLDCEGSGQRWGCGCERCLPREHPMDIGARLSRRQLDEWAAISDAIDRRVTRACVSCGNAETRLYAGGWFCDEHGGRT